MADRRNIIIAKLIVGALGVWALFVSFLEIIGITIYFPLTITQGNEIPYHRLLSLRVSIFLTFAYFSLRYIFFESSKLAPIIFLDVYLKALIISSTFIFISNDVEFAEWRIVIFFIISSIIVHLASRMNIRRYFAK